MFWELSLKETCSEGWCDYNLVHIQSATAEYLLDEIHEY